MQSSYRALTINLQGPTSSQQPRPPVLTGSENTPTTPSNAAGPAFKITYLFIPHGIDGIIEKWRPLGDCFMDKTLPQLMRELPLGSRSSPMKLVFQFIQPKKKLVGWAIEPHDEAHFQFVKDGLDHQIQQLEEANTSSEVTTLELVMQIHAYYEFEAPQNTEIDVYRKSNKKW
jgi:hypothetical protein